MASFQKIVKSILNQLSGHDYPVLNSQLFFKIWLTSEMLKVAIKFYILRNENLWLSIKATVDDCTMAT